MAIGTVIPHSNATKAICLLDNATATSAAPTDGANSMEGVPQFDAKKLGDSSVGHSYPGSAAMSSTLVISSEFVAIFDAGTAATNADSVFKARLPGAAGADITLTFVADSLDGVTVEEDGTDVTVHFEDGVSTVLDVETAIAAESTLITTMTAGTAAAVLVVTDDEFSEEAFVIDEDAAGTFVLWGYKYCTGHWYPITVNDGDELAVVGGSVRHHERYPDLGHFDRLYLQVSAIGASNQAFSAWLITGMESH